MPRSKDDRIFTAANGWKVEQPSIPGHVELRVLGPSDVVMNNLTEGASDALAEFYERRDQDGWPWDPVETPEPLEMDPADYLFNDPGTEPLRSYAKNLNAEWIGRKVRVRARETLVIEDTITQVVHFSGITRLYFLNTKAYPALFSQDEGYRIDGDEMVEVIL